MAELANDCEYGQVALRFAKALSAEDFRTAHSMLCADSKGTTSEAALAQQYREMIEYGDGPATVVEVLMVQDKWPSQKPKDLAWVYVTMRGDGFSEAVNVAIVDEDITTAVRILEWRRP